MADVSGNKGVQVINEARMPTVIREVTTARPSSVDEAEIEMDQSLNDDSRLSAANMASHSVDGSAMLGAVNRVADVSLIHVLFRAGTDHSPGEGWAHRDKRAPL